MEQKWWKHTLRFVGLVLFHYPSNIGSAALLLIFTLMIIRVTRYFTLLMELSSILLQRLVP